MNLPLLQIATAGSSTYLLSRASQPPPLPAPGEQYRFHFRMDKCIGCKCCVVACNEQNGNPAAIQWRRVGEIEGGWFPNTQRHYLSMGCNHCLEPSCMTGCPTEAYTKDGFTGIVRHDPNICIGCQYCTWNCSYGVPQYNAERGVVGKCDMCYGRLMEGSQPACASACPEEAILIETVNIDDWKLDYALSANAPGLPSADDSISTTRITVPSCMPPNSQRQDTFQIHPEQPHWPLVLMLVLTQLSAGAFASLWITQVTGQAASLVAFLIAALALGASTLHLGRPAFAWRALKMWRRSWLSREVLIFAIFAGVACLYAAASLFQLPFATGAGALTGLSGFAGLYCSARIYMVPARPAWNTPRTITTFLLTAAILGPLFLALFGANATPWLPRAAAIAAALQLSNFAIHFFSMISADRYELQASARLLSGVLHKHLLWRAALLTAGVLLPLLQPTLLGLAIGFTAALASEILGRYLFFTGVVPKNMASTGGGL
jgi:Fe-S-cluster-containing dehydrogenase component/DMSO reductase anchor subunit